MEINNNHGGYLTHLGTGVKTVTLTPGYFEGRTFIITGDPVTVELGDEQRALHYVSRGVKECPEENPNPPEFTFEAWPTDYRVVTQAFGNNPAYYGQFGLPGHEGVDIRAPHGTPIYAVASGEVYEVVPAEDGHNYGIRVRIRTGKYRHIYAHLLSADVAVGDSVQAGQQIGLADDTGNSFGSHLHLTLKSDDAAVVGDDYIGYPYDIIDPTSYLVPFAPEWPDNPPDPPTGETVDVTPYFVPSGQYGHKIVMQTGDSTQPMQLEKRTNDVILRKGDGVWFDEVRYQDSEQWRVKDGEVQKGVDTSDAANGGRDGYDLGWAQWIPQIVQVGQTYNSTPAVRRFDRTNGCENTTSTAQANDYLHIKQIIPTWISPANADIVLNDVLVIEWRSGTADLSVPPNETYYFAKEYGYVGWGDHFIVEITQGQAPLSGALDCGL